MLGRSLFPSRPLSLPLGFCVACSLAGLGAAACDEGSDDPGVPSTGGVPGSGGVPSSGGAPSTCDTTTHDWESCTNWEYRIFGHYVVRNNIWGSDNPAAGSQCTWANSESCWGVEATHQNGNGSVKGYPQVIRGWVIGNGFIINNHGLGIRVADLTRARAHWRMDAPETGRFMALWDIYFHATPTPGGETAQTNLMVFQRIVDQDGWFGTDTAGLPEVTLAGARYKMRVSGPGQSATRTVVTLYHDPQSNTLFGTEEMTLDIKALIDEVVALGHISTDEYLTSIQIGWEIIWGGSFQTHDFWTAVQDEPEPG